MRRNDLGSTFVSVKSDCHEECCQFQSRHQACPLEYLDRRNRRTDVHFLICCLVLVEFCVKTALSNQNLIYLWLRNFKNEITTTN